MRDEKFIAADGAVLRVTTFEPPGTPVGVVHIVHGFGEGIEHFYDVAQAYAEHGLVCVIHNQRGFGAMLELTKRERKKFQGIVPGYSYMLSDLRELRGKIAADFPGLPVALHGFSMGGGEVLNYFMRVRGTQELYAKAIVEAPWLRLDRPLVNATLPLVRALGRVSGKLAMSTRLDVDSVVRDKDIVNAFKTDGIFHDRISFKLMSEIESAGRFALEHPGRIRLPVLVVCAGKDKVVDPAAVRRFAGECGDNVEYAEFPESFHNLHADVNKDEVIALMIDFLTK